MALDLLMDEKKAVEYIQENTDIFLKTSNLYAEVLNANTLSVDGYANNIIMVKDRYTGRTVILKQVLPYVRAAKEDDVNIPLPEERIYVEFYSLKLWEDICPGFVPQVYFFDRKNNIIVFEYIENMELLRSALIKEKKISVLPEQIAYFLSRTAFFSSELFLKKEEKSSFINFFAQSNADKIWNDLIFNKNIDLPDEKNINLFIKDEIKKFYQDDDIKNEIKKLSKIFSQKKDALIHSDFHTSNIFVNNKEIKVFDAEFSTYGPPSFDMGRLVGNLILNYASLISMDYSLGKKEYQFYILSLIKKIYKEFKSSFSILVKEYYNDKEDYLIEYFKTHLSETIGFAACTAITRIKNTGLCLDFERIDNLEKRAIGQKFIIMLTSKLLEKRDRFNNIKELIDFISDFRLEYEINIIVKDILKISG